MRETSQNFIPDGQVTLHELKLYVEVQMRYNLRDKKKIPRYSARSGPARWQLSSGSKHESPKR